MPTLTIPDLAGRAVKEQLHVEIMVNTIVNQSNEHTDELVQEVIGKDGLSMTVDIASSDHTRVFCSIFYDAFFLVLILVSLDF